MPIRYSGGCISKSSGFVTYDRRKKPTFRIEDGMGVIPVSYWRTVRGNLYYRIYLRALPYEIRDSKLLASILLCCAWNATWYRRITTLLGVLATVAAPLLVRYLVTNYVTQSFLISILTLLATLGFFAFTYFQKRIKKPIYDCLVYYGKISRSAPYNPFTDVLASILEASRNCFTKQCKTTVSTPLGRYLIKANYMGTAIQAKPLE